MKILTILGTRPEIIRLSRVIPKLEAACTHKVLYTGQNYDPNLSTIFFNELGLKTPNYGLNVEGASLAEQIGKMFTGVEWCIGEFKPDKVLILGDTNSSLTAVICERMGVPVYHMEAGNRCYDLEVPEEVNRRIIDTVSSINMPYTGISRENLLRAGLPPNKVHVVGNPIKEVIDYYTPQITQSDILDKLSIQRGNYVLVTVHRAENVDVEVRLQNIFKALGAIAEEYPVVFSCHPKTRQRIAQYGITPHSNIHISEPFGFFDFIKLEQNCKLAITDSGTVQEEMCIFRIPTITVRNTTERPETVWCGSNTVSGLEVDAILGCYNLAKDAACDWIPPVEYLKTDVSNTVVNILLSK